MLSPPGAAGQSMMNSVSDPPGAPFGPARGHRGVGDEFRPPRAGQPNTTTHNSSGSGPIGTQTRLTVLVTTSY